MAQVIAAIIEPAGRCFNIWAVKAYLVSKLGSIVAFKTDARVPRKTFLLNDRWECPEVGGIARARPTWITNSFVRPLKKVRPCRHRKNVKAKKKKKEKRKKKEETRIARYHAQVFLPLFPIFQLNIHRGNRVYRVLTIVSIRLRCRDFSDA